MAGPLRWDLVGLGFRVVLLGILTVAAVLVMLGDTGRPATTADLLRDLRADRVHSIRYQVGSVEWETGVWRYLAPVPGPEENDLEWLQRQVEATGSPLPVLESTSEETVVWPGRVTWRPLRDIAVLAWFLTLLVMLGRRRHRWANRWAWWWLFVGGLVGPLLYLVLEPSPLWRRSTGARPERLPVPPQPEVPAPAGRGAELTGERRIIRGGEGFLLALGMAMAVSLVRVLVGGILAS